MTVKLLTKHHLEFLSLRGGGGGLHKVIRVHTCKNATLLEIACRGSNVKMSKCYMNER